MSRFYDALKHAGRAPEDAPELTSAVEVSSAPDADGTAQASWPVTASPTDDARVVSVLESQPWLVPDDAEAAPTSNQDKADADAASVLAAEFARLKNGGQSAAAAPAQAPERGSDPWMLVPEQHAHPLPEHGSAIELEGRAKLDRRARLIPNTVDRTVVEHYRRLRTKLVQEHGKKPFGSVMVTSPNAQEGKSVTTLNLALSFAMLPSFRVLVIDGDLRRGSLGKWLGVKDRPGLSNLIEGSAAINDVILKYEDLPIHFMVRGTSTAPAGELLQSSEMSRHFRALTERFSLVLVDSPPVNVVADAHLLAAGCDAVLLIARAFATTRKALEKAADDLRPFRILGTVLNGGTHAQLYRNYGGY